MILLEIVLASSTSFDLLSCVFLAKLLTSVVLSHYVMRKLFTFAPSMLTPSLSDINAHFKQTVFRLISKK